MFLFISLNLFVVLLLIQSVSASVWCNDFSTGNSWTCDDGETCGSNLGECDGMPSYVLYSLIFSSICLLSICIRCCLSSATSSTQSTPRRALRPVQRRAQVRSVGNNIATQSPPNVSVHIVREVPPPSYADAIASTTLIPKN